MIYRDNSNNLAEPDFPVALVFTIAYDYECNTKKHTNMIAEKA